MYNLKITVWCKDAWAPEFTDKFGWSVKAKSIQEELLLCIWVVSLINCENQFEEVSEYNFVSSEVLISSDHQDEDLALNSTVITDTVRLHSLKSLKSCSRFDKNELNSELFWPGEREIADTYLFIIISHLQKQCFFKAR